MGCFYMPKGHRRSNGTQKVEIIERIRSEQLSLHEASKEYDIPRQTLQDWERIYLEEGKVRLAKQLQTCWNGTSKQMRQTANGLQTSLNSRSMNRSSTCRRLLICLMEKWSATTLAASLISSRSRICWKMLFRNFPTKWTILFCTQTKVGSTR